MFRLRVSAIAVVLLALTGLWLAAGPAGAVTNHNPIGALDYVAFDEKYGGVFVSGWAGDPDYGSAPGQRVHVYVDGVGTSLGTGTSRADVARVYPNLGGSTGFASEIKAPAGRGTHTLCAYAINRGPGNTTGLGCKRFTQDLPGALLGHIDHLAISGSTLVASGWVLDPGDAQSPTPTGLTYLRGPRSSGDSDGFNLDAGLPRPDVDRAYPRNGHNHGFSINTDASGLSWTVGSVVCIGFHQYLPGVAPGPTQYCATVTAS